ncbi:hypothetical protein MKX01_016776 [Papaver californicum]|nr:hypothetical protein MKX01_016776 [Papaver californicum]
MLHERNFEFLLLGSPFSLMTNSRIFGFCFTSTTSYLTASMGLQVLWSLGLAFLDVYAMKIKRDLHNPVLVSLFVVGDWVTACSSAGVVVLYTKDMGLCKSLPRHPCSRFQISIVLGFITWFLIFISSLVTFWLLAFWLLASA